MPFKINVAFKTVKSVLYEIGALEKFSIVIFKRNFGPHSVFSVRTGVTGNILVYKT